MSNNAETKKEEFGWLRSTFFPIHFHEVPKFLPMAFMMFFILFNYTLLRNVKDTVITTGRGAGADVIPFVKLWGTTPSAVLFMLFYSKLANLFKREKIFYICIVPFLVFFGAYAFFINPNLEWLHPNPEMIANLKMQFPRIKGLFTMWGNWSSVLFYVLAELWGSVMLSLLFWQFANEICKKQEAKRYYPLFGFIGNIGLIFAGNIGKLCSSMGVNSVAQDSWQVTLNYMMSCIVVSGVLSIILYYTLNRKLNKEPKLEEAAVKTKKKPKLSMTESFKYILSSPHLLFIAILVFAYGISMNFMDVLWKGQVKTMFHGDKNLIQAYYSSYSTTTGYIALPLMLIGGNILRRLSWFKAANITPAIMLVLGIPFFAVIYYGSHHSPEAPMFDIFGASLTAVSLAAGLGYWQNAITKATKYSLFDSTKEMAYIPLDEELRTKGKAAVDVVGGRSGKSGGSFVFVALSTILPNVALVKLSPMIFGVFSVVLVIWFYATFGLNKCLKKIEGKKVEENKVELKAQTA